MTTVDITGQLATYMAQARDMRLAPHVAQDAKHRILDALAAMVSGSHLPAGEMAIQNPLSTERVNEKARSLMTTVLGAERTDEVIGRVNALEKLDDVRELRPLLAG
jgi:hypothetical protein